jgi:EAL domain-containing protein (putative c-di-GMP-specific phosphodiesterase class I)
MVQIAEECGMILPIGHWVFSEAFARFAQWRAAGYPIEMALNLSAVQIHEQDVYGILTGLAAQYSVPLRSVKVEITESVLLNRGARVKETMQALRSAGVGLVLDDFGTGYASLSYLQQFPIGTLKIDSSFVRGIGGSTSDEAIVRGVVKLAHSLGQDVVAEGVETRLQLDFLRDCGCDRAQGYLFGQGLPAADFLAYLQRPGLPPG